MDCLCPLFCVAGPDWSLKLAYCWSHQRRDFVNVVPSADRGQGWADQWVELINQLFGCCSQARLGSKAPARPTKPKGHREARAAPVLLRTRLQRGGPGPPPGTLGPPAGLEPGTLPAGVSGFGLAQCRRTTPSDELPGPLLRMERDGLLQLPKPLKKNGNGRTVPGLTAASASAPRCGRRWRRWSRCSFSACAAPPTRGWNQLIQRHHYPRYRPLSGGLATSKRGATVGARWGYGGGR